MREIRFYFYAVNIFYLHKCISYLLNELMGNNIYIGITIVKQISVSMEQKQHTHGKRDVMRLVFEMFITDKT